MRQKKEPDGGHPTYYNRYNRGMGWGLPFNSPTIDIITFYHIIVKRFNTYLQIIYINFLQKFRSVILLLFLSGLSE
jgi:hypothetical protein